MLVINARVVMLNEDSFHDLKAVGFIIAIYYSIVSLTSIGHVRTVL